MHIGIKISLYIFIFITWLYGANCNLYLQPAKEVHGYFTGDGFFITCHTTETSGEKLKWIDTDEKEITSNDGRIRVQDAGMGLELVVEKVEADDAGKYTCKGVSSSVTFELVVYKAISFLDTAKHQHTREGENALITCRADAQPHPVISWSHKGYSIKDSTKYKILQDGLEIINSSREDAGNYSCTALVTATYASRIKSLDIKFDVRYKPEFVKDEEKMVYTQLHALTNLVCTASASPAPKFRWTRDENTIHNSSDFVIFHTENASTLRLTVHEASQLGEYKCMAMNEIGQAEMTITLEEGDKPDVPAFKITKQKDDTLILELDADDKEDLKITGFKVEFVKTGESWDQAHFQEFNKGDQYILNNVSFNTEYLLRASARNFAGYGNYSEVIQYKTPEAHLADGLTVKDDANTVVTSFVLMIISSCIMGYLIA